MHPRSDRDAQRPPDGHARGADDLCRWFEVWGVWSVNRYTGLGRGADDLSSPPSIRSRERERERESVCLFV